MLVTEESCETIQTDSLVVMGITATTKDESVKEQTDISEEISPTAATDTGKSKDDTVAIESIAEELDVIEESNLDKSDNSKIFIEDLQPPRNASALSISTD